MAQGHPVLDRRITLVHGDRYAGPNELIGVLEVRADGNRRAAIAERARVDGRCHIRLARQAWTGKDALETRWWSMALAGPAGRCSDVGAAIADAALRTDRDQLAHVCQLAKALCGKGSP